MILNIVMQFVSAGMLFCGLAIGASTNPPTWVVFVGIGFVVGSILMVINLKHEDLDGGRYPVLIYVILGSIFNSALLMLSKEELGAIGSAVVGVLLLPSMLTTGIATLCNFLGYVLSKPGFVLTAGILYVAAAFFMPGASKYVPISFAALTIGVYTAMQLKATGRRAAEDEA